MVRYCTSHEGAKHGTVVHCFCDVYRASIGSYSHADGDTMITYSAADRNWFEREVGSLTISQSEAVYLSNQSDCIPVQPPKPYLPDFQQAIQRATAQQRVQTLNHRPPPQGRTIPLSTVVFILTCCAFGALVALLELVGRSIQ